MYDTTTHSSTATNARPVDRRDRRRSALRILVGAAAGVMLILQVAGGTSAQSDRTPSESCEWSDGSYSPACRMTPGAPDGWFRAPEGEPPSGDATQADTRYR